MFPKVSVVTVTYNAADYVEKTIKSVISQKYDCMEYIIIDGNSKDETMNIVNHYKDSIHIIVSEPDKGIYDAMNKGLHLASGEWIIFMNAGDTFDNPSVLNNVFSRKIQENSSLIFGNITHYSKDLRVKQIHAPQIATSQQSPFPYRERMPGSHQATFYRTQILKEHPYRSKEFKIAADWASMADILDLNQTYTVVDENIAWYPAGGTASHISFSHLHEREIICGYTFRWKDKAKMVLFQRLRKLIIRLLPRTISTAVRRNYFIKNLGFSELTKEDIESHLVF